MVTRFLSKLMCVTGQHFVTYLRSGLLLLSCSLKIPLRLLHSFSCSPPAFRPWHPMLQLLLLSLLSPILLWRRLPLLLWPGDIVLLILVMVAAIVAWLTVVLPVLRSRMHPTPPVPGGQCATPPHLATPLVL
jgi:hypothetical protein